jgi:hypothetical protein
MAASKREIESWFDRAAQNNVKFMIVVCDTWDHEDYPVYAKDAEEARTKYAQFNDKNMQRVMEVYDLSLPKDEQMAEYRAMHLP